MTSLLWYCAKLSFSLMVIALFYQLVLRRLTFYNWNRLYLLVYTLLCFWIPFINITPVLDKQQWSQNALITWVPVIHDSATAGPAPASSSSLFSFSQLGILLLAAGIMFMLLRLLLQVWSFHRMRRRSVRVQGQLVNVYEVNEPIIPFSFGNSIFINPSLHSAGELQEIITHEFVHVKQKHSIDIIWGEILCVLNWYNPFAWMLKKAIRQNLEFIADHQVLRHGISKKEYQYLLLKVMGNTQFSIANQFNFSSLKKRIAMMNKLKTTNRHLVKFAFVLPVLAVILLSFRHPFGTGRSAQIHRTGLVGTKDTLPGMIKMPEGIASISIIDSKDDNNATDPLKKKKAGTVVIKRKDGEKEVYDLGSEASQEAFKKKYGVNLEDLIPQPPPPPPPPPAAMSLPDNVKTININNGKAVVTLKNGETESYNLNVPGEKEKYEEKYGPVLPPPPPPGHGENAANATLSRLSDDFDITDTKAVIHLKSGKTEKYDLTNEKEKKAFETKYGAVDNFFYTYDADIITAPAVVVNGFQTSGRGASSPVAPRVVTGVNMATSVSAPTAVTVTGVNVTPAVSINSNVNTPVAVQGVVTTVGRPMPVTVKGKLVSTATGLAPEAGNGYLNFLNGNEALVVTITPGTSRSQLDDFIGQMKNQGVTLSFSVIEYNSAGKLTKLKGTMVSGDSQSNFTANDFQKMILGVFKENGQTVLKVLMDPKEVI